MNRGLIFAETLAKFREIFHVPVGQLKLTDVVEIDKETGDEVTQMEEFEDTFWYEIVEAGWAPKSADVFLQNDDTDEQTRNEVLQACYAAQAWAASVIGLPSDIIDF